MNRVFADGCDPRGIQLLALVLALHLLGCAPTIETMEVSGQVLFKDAPVAGGVVNFFPTAGGRPFAGILNDQGHYQIKLPVGGYSVTVQSSSNLPEGFEEGDPLPPPDPNAVPIRYRHQKRSGLTAQVLDQSGEQEINFKLI